MITAFLINSSNIIKEGGGGGGGDKIYKYIYLYILVHEHWCNKLCLFLFFESSSLRLLFIFPPIVFSNSVFTETDCHNFM